MYLKTFSIWKINCFQNSWCNFHFLMQFSFWRFNQSGFGIYAVMVPLRCTKYTPNVIKISLVPEKHFQAEKSIWCQESWCKIYFKGVIQSWFGTYAVIVPLWYTKYILMYSKCPPNVLMICDGGVPYPGLLYAKQNTDRMLKFDWLRADPYACGLAYGPAELQSILTKENT